MEMDTFRSITMGISIINYLEALRRSLGIDKLNLWKIICVIIKKYAGQKNFLARLMLCYLKISPIPVEKFPPAESPPTRIIFPVDPSDVKLWSIQL